MFFPLVLALIQLQKGLWMIRSLVKIIGGGKIAQ